MKYCCRECKCVVDTTPCNPNKEDIPLECPVCADVHMILFPKFETPKQYEERMGEPLPLNFPVWFRRVSSRQPSRKQKWMLFTYGEALQKRRTWTNDTVFLNKKQIVCAGGSPPPNNWQPGK